jgi:small-conductance mechanosensitive channel
MIMRVKFKTVPGQQFLVRREVFRLMQEAFHEQGIEFAHRNVTVYIPPETSERMSESQKDQVAGAAAALAAAPTTEEEPTEKK